MTIRVFKILFSVIFGLALLEVLLRLTGIYKTHYEQATGEYQSFYGKTIPTHYPVLKTKDTVSSAGEFNYIVVSNSDGFREAEFDSALFKRKRKLLVLGDSFTEGVGAPADSTWPKLLENKLNESGDSFKVINCGIANSDPFFESKLFLDKLYKLKPEILLLSVNYSDLADVICRGGRERFLKNGTTKYRDAPKVETVYKHCYIARAFLHLLFRYDFILLSPHDYERESAIALSKITDELVLLNQFCQENNIGFLLIVHPYFDPYDPFLKKQDNIRELSSLAKKYDVKAIDLFPALLSVINKTNYKQYSWPIDKHFTPLGYDLFAASLHEQIKSDYPEILNADKVTELTK